MEPLTPSPYASVIYSAPEPAKCRSQATLATDGCRPIWELALLGRAKVHRSLRPLGTEANLTVAPRRVNVDKIEMRVAGSRTCR